MQAGTQDKNLPWNEEEMHGNFLQRRIILPHSDDVKFIKKFVEFETGISECQPKENKTKQNRRNKPFNPLFDWTLDLPEEFVLNLNEDGAHLGKGNSHGVWVVLRLEVEKWGWWDECLMCVMATCSN